MKTNIYAMWNTLALSEITNKNAKKWMILFYRVLNCVLMKLTKV